jgi:hypothetical protein
VILIIGKVDNQTKGKRKSLPGEERIQEDPIRMGRV